MDAAITVDAVDNPRMPYRLRRQGVLGVATANR